MGKDEILGLSTQKFTKLKLIQMNLILTTRMVRQFRIVAQLVSYCMVKVQWQPGRRLLISKSNTRIKTIFLPMRTTSLKIIKLLNVLSVAHLKTLRESKICLIRAWSELKLIKDIEMLTNLSFEIKTHRFHLMNSELTSPLTIHSKQNLCLSQPRAPWKTVRLINRNSKISPRSE